MRRDSEPALVSTDWLDAHLQAPDIRVVDASWHLPDTGRDARAEYEAAHIPGAIFFDIDEIADNESPLPHMLPPAEKFAARMRRMGIGDGNRVIVYDSGAGLPSAPRAWWTFRVFGHGDVAILNGGLRKWRAEGRTLDDMPPMPRQRHFTARLQDPLVADRDAVVRALDDAAVQVVDVRSAARFSGAAPEPRPGLRAGHMPGSLNLPYDALYKPDGTLQDEPELMARMKAHGLDLSKPVIASCGSGISACSLALALHVVGHRAYAVYDGSWAEWGSRDDLPVTTGSD